jgi:membrane protein
MRNHPLVRMAEITLDKYQRDNVGGLAAALAYFTIFSIFPLLLVVLSLVGFVVDPERFDVQEQLLGLIGSPEIRDLLAQTLAHFTDTRVGAGLIGAATLFFAATGIFGVLRRTFMIIWESRLIVESGNIKTAVVRMVLARLVAIGLVLGIAGLILVAVVGNLILSLFAAYTDWLPLNTLLLLLGQRALTIALISVAFATIYKVLPGKNVAAWGDVWPGALLAALAFAVVQQLAELIFGRVNFSSFGVLGGAMALLMWIYISSQILLVGGEITYAWAQIFGSRRGQLRAESLEPLAEGR